MTTGKSGKSRSAQVSGADAVRDAILHARSFAEEAALVGRPAMRLAILIEELVSNIVNHGKVPPCDAIGLQFLREGEEVIVIVSDTGAPFDPRLVVDAPAPNPEDIGGKGLHMMRAWAEVLDYVCTDGTNTIHLRLKEVA